MQTQEFVGTKLGLDKTDRITYKEYNNVELAGVQQLEQRLLHNSSIPFQVEIKS